MTPSIDQMIKQMIADEVAKLKDEITKELLKKFDRTLDVMEAAEHLGIGKQKLYNMCASKKIPHIRIGQTIRFKLSQLEEWIEEQSVK